MGSKNQKKDTPVKEVSKAVKKPKLFKLGEKATLFVDSVSKMKVLPGQNVEFDGKAMSTKKFKIAKTAGHLVEAGADEDATELEQVNPDLVDFLNSGSKEQKLEYIKDNYEVTEEEEAALAALSEAELDEEFKKTYLTD